DRQAGHFEKYSRAWLPRRKLRRPRSGLRGDGDGSCAAAFDAAPFIALAPELRASRGALWGAHGGRFLLRAGDGHRMARAGRRTAPGDQPAQRRLERPDGLRPEPARQHRARVERPRRASLRIERDDRTDARTLAELGLRGGKDLDQLLKGGEWGVGSGEWEI